MRVDLERLEALVERMASFQTHLVRLHDEAQTRQRAVQASWTGAAAAAQEHVAAQWQTGAAQVHEALATLRLIGVGAHANYYAAVKANTRMWAESAVTVR